MYSMHQVLLLLIMMGTSTNSRNVYIVDGSTGNDLNSGLSTTEALETIGECVKQLSEPGDMCEVREASYHEVVEIEALKGTTDNPIVIKGYGEERPVWDGMVHIQESEWEWDTSTGICSKEIAMDIFALFLDDDLLTPARWPNAFWSDKTIFDNSYWRPCDHASSHGTIVDKELASAGADVSGAMAILNVGSFETWVREVLHHEAGSDRFTYNHDFGAFCP